MLTWLMISRKYPTVPSLYKRFSNGSLQTSLKKEGHHDVSCRPLLPIPNKPPRHLLRMWLRHSRILFTLNSRTISLSDLHPVQDCLRNRTESGRINGHALAAVNGPCLGQGHRPAAVS